MIKRLAVVLLAVAMLMSYAGMAAAQFSDTAGYKHEAAINRLASLKILEGYPDGTFKPSGAITRAEFAKVICVALGLRAAAEVMAGTPTAFSDVAVDHWATGYINVAASQGIVNGYPDGTFKPDAQVTYAEALAMIIRALGYEPSLKGVWPAKYLVKAAELGVSDGVTFAANAPAERGAVAALVDNSLTVPKMVQIGYGDEVKYVVSGTKDYPEEKTLLGDLGCTKIEGVVTDSGALLGSGLAADKIKVKVDTTESTYKLTADVDAASLAGLEIEGWVNEDDELFLVTEVKDSDVKAAYVVKIIEASGTDPARVQLGKPGDYKEYAVADDATVLYNFSRLDDPDDLDDAWANSDYVYAKYLLKDRKITYLNIVDYRNPRVVDRVDTKYQVVRVKAGNSISYGDLEEYVLTRDGRAVSIEDLEENDVLYAWFDAEQERAVMVAFSNRASGELEAASSDWKTLTVSGNDYKALPNFDFYLSDDEGATFEDATEADAVDYLGTDVVLYLGFDGKVVAISGTPVVSAAQYALVKGGAGDAEGVIRGGLNNETIYVRLYDKNGTKHDVEVTSTTKFNGTRIPNWSSMTSVQREAAVEGEICTSANDVVGGGVTWHLIKYSLTSDGKLSAAERVDIAAADDLTVDDDNDRITFGASTSLYKASTVIFDISGGSVETATWAGLEDGAGLEGVVKQGSGNVAQVIIVTAGTVSVPTDLAMVTGLSVVGGGTWKLTVDLKGESRSYTFDEVDVVADVVYYSNWGPASDEWGHLKKGNIVKLEFDGEDLSEVIEERATNAADTVMDSDCRDQNGYATVKSVSASDKMLKLDTDNDGDEDLTLFTTSDTVIYDCTGSSPVYVTLGEVSKGDLVQFLRNGSTDKVLWVKVIKMNSQDKYKIMGD